MSRFLSSVSVALLVFLAADAAHAAVVTIEGTVKSVDAKKRTISVKTKTKTLELDVSRKAKIRVAGKTTELSSLKAGQKVKLSYHDELEIVLKIEAKFSNSKAGIEFSLFNGRNLDGWSQLTHRGTKDSNKNTWIADPDRKVLASLGGDWNELRTAEKFKNFTLALEWRFTPGRFVSGNGGGIVVRSNGLNTIGFDPRGIEIDFRPKANSEGTMGTGCFIAYSMSLKNRRGETQGEIGKGQPVRHLGWLKKPTLRPAGQWNETEVTCEGDRIKVKINGELINKGWGVPEESGHICLRNQNTSIEFRNIHLIELKSSEAKERGNK